VLLIQIAAAALLLLGSWLIFRALLEIDAPARPRHVASPRPRLTDPEPQPFELPRAA
jgi:hypothetical protein